MSGGGESERWWPWLLAAAAESSPRRWGQRRGGSAGGGGGGVDVALGLSPAARESGWLLWRVWLWPRFGCSRGQRAGRLDAASDANGASSDSDLAYCYLSARHDA